MLWFVACGVGDEPEGASTLMMLTQKGTKLPLCLTGTAELFLSQSPFEGDGGGSHCIRAAVLAFPTALSHYYEALIGKARFLEDEPPSWSRRRRVSSSRKQRQRASVPKKLLCS